MDHRHLWLTVDFVSYFIIIMFDYFSLFVSMVIRRSCILCCRFWRSSLEYDKFFRTRILMKILLTSLFLRWIWYIYDDMMMLLIILRLFNIFVRVRLIYVNRSSISSCFFLTCFYLIHHKWTLFAILLH